MCCRPAPAGGAAGGGRERKGGGTALGLRAGGGAGAARACEPPVSGLWPPPPRLCPLTRAVRGPTEAPRWQAGSPALRASSRASARPRLLDGPGGGLLSAGGTAFLGVLAVSSRRRPPRLCSWGVRPAPRSRPASLQAGGAALAAVLQVPGQR